MLVILFAVIDPRALSYCSVDEFDEAEHLVLPQWQHFLLVHNLLEHGQRHVVFAVRLEVIPARHENVLYQQRRCNSVEHGVGEQSNRESKIVK